MSFGDYLENALLDHVFSKTTYTGPASLYIGLSTTTPADDGTNITEPSGDDGYARVAVTNNATKWPAASGGSKSNGEAISFPIATGDWGEITHFIVMDDPTAGHMLGFGELTAHRDIITGDVPSFAAGQLTITLD